MATTTRRAPAAQAGAATLFAAYKRHLDTARGLSPATVRNYIADLTPFAEYLAAEGVPLEDDLRGLRAFVERDGERGVSGVYRRLIRDYVSWLLEGRTIAGGRDAGGRGHSRGSVVRSLVALRSFMRWLIDGGKMPDSPLWQPRSRIMRTFTPKAPRRLPDVVSTAEAARMIESPASKDGGSLKHQASVLRDRAVLELLYGSGLRVSEVSGLDLKHVTLSSRTVRVLGKGAKTRVVPISGPAIAALHRYLQDGRPTLRSPSSGDALFLNQRGGRLGVRTVQEMVQRYAQEAELRPGVHPHTLRHSFATHLLDGGADLRVVQELLGHSTPSATQVYTHISQAEARKAYLSAHPLARQRADDA